MSSIPQHTSSDKPRHIAIIMDGNGRWAKARGLSRIEGHRRGVENVRKVVKASQEHGIEVLTLYAFSVENWNRPRDEVDALMSLLHRFLSNQLNELLENKVRLKVIGRYHELPERIQKSLKDAVDKTANFTKQTLALAINYGSRTEIVDAIKAYTKDVVSGSVDPHKLDFENLRPYLYTNGLPDPDLIIRTSGEFRLSNFLLLQGAYAEIFISPVFWPDFSREHFDAAIKDYIHRERRYGKTAEQLE